MNNINIWIQHINSIAGRHVGLCTKVIWPTALFSNSKHLFVQCFVSRPTGQHGIAVHQWSNLSQYLFVINLSSHCLRQNFNLYQKVNNLLLHIDKVQHLSNYHNIKHKY